MSILRPALRLAVMVALAGLPVTLPLPTPSPTPLPVSAPTVLPLPVSTPTLLPLPVSTPSLPPLPISTPSPSLPPILPTPAPSATPPVGTIPPPSPGTGGGDPAPSPPPVLHTQPRGNQSKAPNGGSGSNGPIGFVLVPAMILPAGPLGVALAVALAALPLLLGLALLLLGRLWGEARRMRSARLRLALAAELDLKPHELAQLSPAGLLKLRDQVAFDELTGVLRRAAGIASVEREIARSRRAHTPLVAAFIDVDGLKRVNDRRGHRAGDQLLRGVADLLGGGLRKQDLVFRYGGDEFVSVLPGIELAAAEDKLRDLRQRGQDSGVPFSFGVAELRDEDDLVSFLGRADQLLYDSRARRRDELTSSPVVPLRPPDSRASGRRRPRSAT